MATIYDLIELTSLNENTTYSNANGGILGIVDGVTSSELDDGEFDEGDEILIGGTWYSIDEIEEPSDEGYFTLGDGSTTTFDSASESNLDVIFLTLVNGGDVRYFAIPNDSYGNMNIQSITIANLNGAAGSDAATISTGNNDINVVCFARGTLIDVGGGVSTPIECLHTGDQVLTLDSGLQEIKWIGYHPIGPKVLKSNPNLRPVRIRQGALGADCPTQDLIVSPQHRLLLQSKVAQRMFDAGQVLVAAKHLSAIDGIDVVSDSLHVEYYHILTENHEVVIANGAPCETLLLGDQAMQSVGPNARDEIFDLFPDTRSNVPWQRPCRVIAAGHRGRKLAERHAKNNKALVQSLPTMIVPLTHPDLSTRPHANLC